MVFDFIPWPHQYSRWWSALLKLHCESLQTVVALLTVCIFFLPPSFQALQLQFMTHKVLCVCVFCFICVPERLSILEKAIEDTVLHGLSTLHRSTKNRHTGLFQITLVIEDMIQCSLGGVNVVEWPVFFMWPQEVKVRLSHQIETQ